MATIQIPGLTRNVGLGDVVKYGLDKVGIKQGPGCGCPRRQAAMNRWLSFSGRQSSVPHFNVLRKRYAISGGSGGSTEDLCTSLGSGCICGEPMNTNSHDSGETSWPGSFGGFLDFDDSPNDTECFSSLGGGAENYCTSGAGPSTVTGASQNSFLPVGHSLSHLFKGNGGGICQVGSAPSLNESANFTLCMRAYRRWDAASHVPSNNCEQQKIMTIGGVELPSNFITIQISLHSGGGIGTRFDGTYWRVDGGVAAPDLGSMFDCQSNFCRFEICLDVNSSGHGQARYRRTKVAPGDGSSVTVENVASTSGDINHDPVAWTAVAGGGWALYGQCALTADVEAASGDCNAPGVIKPCIDISHQYITYNTHYIYTIVRPENRSWWPGAASEVEGGGGGIVTPTRGQIRRLAGRRWR